ncbi:hypothetical protein ACFQNE_02615 [Gordonia phosphorivorans]|uniref:Uncharacterized protein n=1 Tax=Gordonia phosphorivorans TaxID=1056982 RepID=A0ABV6H477_9ACTN
MSVVIATTSSPQTTINDNCHMLDAVHEANKVAAQVYWVKIETSAARGTYVDADGNDQRVLVMDLATVADADKLAGAAWLHEQEWLQPSASLNPHRRRR